MPASLARIASNSGPLVCVSRYSIDSRYWALLSGSTTHTEAYLVARRLRRVLLKNW
jgi:hypothetical protein